MPTIKLPNGMVAYSRDYPNVDGKPVREIKYKDDNTSISLLHTDNVNHPAHYKSESGLEVIDIIDDFVPDPGSYYLGNIIKYVLRFQKKGGVEDLEKARWYLNKLIARESVKED